MSPPINTRYSLHASPTRSSVFDPIKKRLAKIFRRQEKLTLAYNGHWYHRHKIRLNMDKFNTHMYVVGKTGQGKSKFLQQMLYQMAQTKRWGCGLLDPHADLALGFLRHLATFPRHRPWLTHIKNRERLIYLDPSRSDYIIPFNILKNSFSQPHDTAENIIEAFRRTWPETLADAPRFEAILRNTLIALIDADLTMLEIAPLLRNREFRERVLTHCRNEQVIEYFHLEFDSWNSRQAAEYCESVLNKVNAFLSHPRMRQMLGSSDNYLDARKIIDGRKVFIVNLGTLGAGKTKRLLGSLLLTQLENAAASREGTEDYERIPFFQVVDEFHKFCPHNSEALDEAFSETRKYRFHVCVAHQTISQLSERMWGAIENADYKVIFGSGRGTAETITPENFKPNTTATKPPPEENRSPVYKPLSEQYEDFIQQILSLSPRKVYVKLPSRKTPLTVGKVVNVPKPRFKKHELEELRQALAKTAGLPARSIEQQITERRKMHGLEGIGQVSDSRESASTHKSFWRSEQKTYGAPSQPSNVPPEIKPAPRASRPQQVPRPPRHYTTFNRSTIFLKA